MLKVTGTATGHASAEGMACCGFRKLPGWLMNPRPLPLFLRPALEGFQSPLHVSSIERRDQRFQQPSQHEWSNFEVVDKPNFCFLMGQSLEPPRPTELAQYPRALGHLNRSVRGRTERQVL